MEEGRRERGQQGKGFNYVLGETGEGDLFDSQAHTLNSPCWVSFLGCQAIMLSAT